MPPKGTYSPEYKTEDEAGAPETQAERIIRKFGGVPRLLELLRIVGKPRNKASVYKWTYPASKGGTGGLIPTSAWPAILLAARLDGILITSQDMDPRVDR
jgi:hypothetical protein